MKFFTDTGQFLGWLLRVLGVFFRIRPVTTLSLVLASTGSRVTTILAAFLPLKVLLLAANPGVPSYFPFVDPAYKEEWVAGLAAASVAAYFFMLGLDALSRKLAEIGGTEVLQGANDLALMHDQRTQARAYYAMVCDTVAGFLFAMTLFAVLPVLNLELFQAIMILVAAYFLVTALFYKREHANGSPRGVSRMLDEKLPGYLGFLSSITFFSGLAVLLYPYLVGTGRNLLLSMLAIILMRQLLQYLSQAVSRSATLARKRGEIDPLVFPERQLKKAIGAKEKQLRLTFPIERRNAIAATALQQNGVDFDELQVHWQDPIVPHFHLFEIKLTAGEAVKTLQMQAYPGVGNHQLVSEEFLFGLVSREALQAPPVVARFREDGYEVQVCVSGETLSAREFAKLSPELALRVSETVPPPALVKSYSRSRPFLWQRVDEEAVMRMDLAADTAATEDVHRQLLLKLPRIREVLSEMPLIILNPALGPKNVVRRTAGDGLFVMTWGRWTLEPLGAGVPGKFNRKRMKVLLDHLRTRRSDVDEKLSLEHLRLAQQMWVLDRALRRGAYRDAMEFAEGIVGNPLLESEPAETKVTVGTVS